MSDYPDFMKNLDKKLAERRKYVEKARAWSNGNITAFMSNRINFQRGKRSGVPEKEDYSQSKNPETALMNTLIDLRGEELGMWTPEEEAKVRNIICAYVSVTFNKLKERNPAFWTDLEYPVLEQDSFFGASFSVTLKNDEAEALSMLLNRVGTSIDPNQRKFMKPYIDPNSHWDPK